MRYLYARVRIYVLVFAYINVYLAFVICLRCIGRLACLYIYFLV